MSTIVAKTTSTQTVNGQSYPAFAWKDVNSLWATDPAVDVIELGTTKESCKRSQAAKTQQVQITSANKVLTGRDPAVVTPHNGTGATTPVTPGKKATSSINWEFKDGVLSLIAPDVHAEVVIQANNRKVTGSLASLLAFSGMLSNISKFGGKALFGISEYCAGVKVEPGYRWGPYSTQNMDINTATLELKSKAMSNLPGMNLAPDKIMAEVKSIMNLIPISNGVSNRDAMCAAFPEPVAPVATPPADTTSNPPAKTGDNSDLK